jgi:hypothetical protein
LLSLNTQGRGRGRSAWDHAHDAAAAGPEQSAAAHGIPNRRPLSSCCRQSISTIYVTASRSITAPTSTRTRSAIHKCGISVFRAVGSRSLIISTEYRFSGSTGSGRVSGHPVRFSYAPAAMVPFGCSLDMAHTPARPVTGRFTCANGRTARAATPSGLQAAPANRRASRYLRTNAFQAQMDAPQDYQRIRNEIQALEAKAKAQRFKKPLSSQLFAYHVG